MRRKAAGMMAVCLILAAIVWPAQVLAAQDEVVYYEDGSYAVVVMKEENTVTRATNRKTGSKAYKYYTADDELVWTVTLNATFSYNGSSATCTSVNSLNVTIYDDSWSTYSKSSTKSGNTATDDNAEIRNLDARLFEKSTCWHTSLIRLNSHCKNLHQYPKQ